LNHPGGKVVDETVQLFEHDQDFNVEGSSFFVELKDEQTPEYFSFSQ
jgi:hypothetical protein